MASLPRTAFRSLCISAAFLLLPSARAAATCFALFCAGDVTSSNDPNQCGATVGYGAPTPVIVPPGDCGTITCVPASGSFFPVGTTQVTCTASAGPDCTLGVTVSDTQAPQITVPEDLLIVGTDPGVPLPVTYMAPTASDNCPGVTLICNPPAGSTFPIGETSVTCTATDASANTASDSFLLTYFDACVQDDASGEFVRWRTSDGLYEFFDCTDSACGEGGFKRTGIGDVTPTHAGFALRDVKDDRSVNASVQTGKRSGKASLKFRTGSTRLSSKLKDSKLFDDSCLCQ